MVWLRNLALVCISAFLLLWALRTSRLAGESFSVIGFKLFGKPIFLSVQEASIKRVLLEPGSYLGQPVIIEGEVTLVGKHNTYFLINDEESNLIVVTTKLADGVGGLHKTHVRVLGVIENEKFGVPMLRAWDINRRS